MKAAFKKLTCLGKLVNKKPGLPCLDVPIELPEQTSVPLVGVVDTGVFGMGVGIVTGSTGGFLIGSGSGCVGTGVFTTGGLSALAT